MSVTTVRTRERMLHAILSRAASDPAFRSGLLAEPKQTISEAFGVTIPDQFRVRFIEKGPNLDALVVLPDLRAESSELSESDLEVVNGGGASPSFDDDAPW
jgi:hypothetical protein